MTNNFIYKYIMPIYCGLKRTPPGKTRGNVLTCFRKGMGVGRFLERQDGNAPAPAPRARATNAMNLATLRVMAQARGVPITANRVRKNKARLIADINNA
jgi:hypothetical protein